MKLLLRHSFFILCALYLAGAHWVLLQMTAWTGMLVTRVQTESVASAVKATFDGQHPCPLCKAIKNARNQEKQKEAPLLKKSQELKLVESKSRSLLPIPFVSDEREWPDFILVALKRAEVPLTPPPNV